MPLIIAFAAAILVALVPAAAYAQGPTFDAAVIRPAAPLDMARIQAGNLPRIGMTVTPGRVALNYLTIRELVLIAYGVRPYQVIAPAAGLPTQRFDVEATLPAGATQEQVPLMMQALLAERFRLAVRRESRPLPVYELVVGKDGPKLKPAAAPATPPAEPPAPGAQVFGSGDQTVSVSRTPGGVSVTNPQTGTMRMGMGTDGRMQMQMSSVTIPALAEMLNGFADRPVMDKTGLTGRYEVALELAMADMLNAARAAGITAGMPIPALPAGAGQGPGGQALPGNLASEPAGGGSVFQAVERLGLRLEPRTAPIDVVVIERVEPTPTEN